jgi:hypothetical protein
LKSIRPSLRVGFQLAATDEAPCQDDVNNLSKLAVIQFETDHLKLCGVLDAVANLGRADGRFAFAMRDGVPGLCLSGEIRQIPGQ